MSDPITVSLLVCGDSGDRWEKATITLRRVAWDDGRCSGCA